MSRIGVAVLGATGMVGQHMLRMLEDHPWLQLRAVCASDRSVGQLYGDAAPWRIEGEPPAELAKMVVRGCNPEDLPSGVKVVLSGLPTDVARRVEPAMRAAGLAVVSNAGAFRADPDVPLLIPEVNAHHLSLLSRQGGPGFIVTNPNCCAVPLALMLAPLHRALGVEAVCTSTWQAVSGAGYPGEPSWDILGNAHPHAGDEEEKLAFEPKKILGEPDKLAEMLISARCVRVPVMDGHLVSAQVRTRTPASPAEVAELLQSYRPEIPELPSASAPLFFLSDRRDRPAARFDAWRGEGMTVTVGRIEPCPVMGIKLYGLAHNVVRGAAGAALANTELLIARGLIK